MENEKKSMHPAETYLRNPDNPRHIHVIIDGKKRKLFLNERHGPVGIIAQGKRKQGYLFDKWDTIEKVLYPEDQPKSSELEENRKLINKFKRLAAKASFTNSFIEEVMKADPDKSPFENRITTGTGIDGQCITLSTINKWFQKEVNWGEDLIAEFREAFRNRKKFSSGTFNFQGYDGKLWCEPREDGHMYAGFMKEYRGCGNGYYYLLINDDTVIGVDID